VSAASPIICLVDVCSGNLRSVERAIATTGATVIRTSDPAVVRKADKIVVPGQGAFAPFMMGLQQTGIGEALRETLGRGTPYLGICLGMQVLFDESDEVDSGAVPVNGLGMIRGRVERLSASASSDTIALKIPHMGWNQVRRAESTRSAIAQAISDDEHFYFVHSYVVKPTDPADIALTSEYGQRFCAAVAKDNLFACQFHPEKSQQAGLSLLRHFVEQS
jgi:imidazole glycerol-phosphate synthase subunit HisH